MKHTREHMLQVNESMLRQAKNKFLQGMPFCWREGGEEIQGGGRERERAVVSIFSSSRGALRLTNSCFYAIFASGALWCLG